MSDENNDSTGNAPSVSPEVAEQITKLTSQVDNLGKAVSEARDATKAAKAEGEKTIEELRKQLEKGAKGTKEDLDLTDEEVQKFQKFAEKNNLVTKEDLNTLKSESQRQTAASVEQQAISELVEKYPVFEDDVEWDKLKTEFALYKTPSTLPEYRKLLNRIVKDLKGDDSKEQGANETRAEIRNRERLALGGKAPGGTGESSELEILAKRYPNLSKDQLKEQLSELDELLPKEDK